jgi:hypothetical protein
LLPELAALQAFRETKRVARQCGVKAALLLLNCKPELLLPGPFLVTVSAQLLAPFMFINFGFPSFL